jgi:hypothetical protein
MTTTIDAEAEKAETLTQRVAHLGLADAAVRRARTDLRHAGLLVENKARQDALTACREADTAVTKASVGLDAARRHRDGIHVRANAGDESLTGMEVAAADADATLAEQRLVVVEREARRVKGSHTDVTSDNHLANLAADIIESVTTMPVIVRSLPETAPRLDRMIVLSQRAGTEGYGTLEASGVVDVLVVGGAGHLDWRIVDQAFTDAGCDAQVSETGIVFNRASWPLPRLSEPRSGAVHQFADRAVSMWVAMIERHDMRDRFAEMGYSGGSTIRDVTALAEVISATLTAEDGKATGTALLRLGVKYRGGGTAVGADDLIAEADELVRALSKDVGDVTEAGQIVSVELVSAERSDGSVWNVAATYGATGHALWPATITSEVRLTFAYESAYGHEIAED